MKTIPYITEAELNILIHSLGIQKKRVKFVYYTVGGYRNYFSPSDDALNLCEALESKGFMYRYFPPFSQYPNYSVSEAGKAALILAGYKINEQ